ncbi:HupE/UreJ family protein [Polycladomyces sp. WAk]|uniref:HupE/UreJ family protein n=1 Tax=Polycladomyces zharkentensis TaxID=2807616 RepID=A0ABS2WLF4_9BACL|nr:HupE/UreJ family protein [Polycladomyces sp. WAk]MBN2910397.1 HupE/UreJ family protein [Polycladomyces sp. WAk]
MHIRCWRKMIPVIMFVLFWPVMAAAHPVYMASTYIKVKDREMTVTIHVDTVMLAKAVGIKGYLALDVPAAQWTIPVKEKVFTYVQTGWMVQINGRPAKPTEMELRSPDPGHADIQMRYVTARPIGHVEIDDQLFFEQAEGKHQNTVTIDHGGKQNRFLLTDNQRHFAFSPSDQMSIWPTVLRFVQMGVEHIWLGYDHLAFLFALLLTTRKGTDIIKIVTSFTVAHSITLGLAAMGIVAVPSRWIESFISLSIVYVAVENQWFHTKNISRRWIVAFYFGLVHGFGFAGALADADIPLDDLLVSLVSFNAGVEIGQLVIVGVLFPLLLWITRFRWHVWVVRGVSVLIGFLGLIWFVQRTFG